MCEIVEGNSNDFLLLLGCHLKKKVMNVHASVGKLAFRQFIRYAAISSEIHRPLKQVALATS